MIDDCMKSDRIIGMIQPKKTGELKKPNLYEIGCIGKVTSFNETRDGRYLIILNGLCRFRILDELNTEKLYRKCEVSYDSFELDLSSKKEGSKVSELKSIFIKLKNLFKKQGYIINWKDIESKNPNQTLNTLSMASPFTLEEKQILLETKNFSSRKEKLENILETYSLDNFNNTTLQ
tara:strand:- start:59 stop:589 length:531 start_codon:yes stop_codon:yes gene_type:complete